MKSLIFIEFIQNIKIIYYVFFILISGILHSQDVINVPVDYPTIQEAIDNVRDEWTIEVEDGIYHENLTAINLGVNCTLKSVNGSENCIIDADLDGDGIGESGGLLVRTSHNFSVTIDGFTIKNGATIIGEGGCGAGIRIDHSNAILKDLVIKNSETELDGGGICLYQNQNIYMEDIIIENNIARKGAGLVIIMNFEPLMLNNIKIINNENSGGDENDFGAGLSVHNSAVYIINSYITDNYSPIGGAAIYANQSFIKLSNTTIANNHNSTGESILINMSSTLEIENSIYWDNTPNTILSESYESCNLSINYSDIEGDEEDVVLGNWEMVDWSAETIINIDPNFADPENEDFHLTYYSPCIDGGNPDLDGDGDQWFDDIDNQDPDGTRMDIGAIYFNKDPGDLNGDTEINIIDVLILVDIIFGILPDNFEILNIIADLNNDGIINILDIMEIINIILYFILPPWEPATIYLAGVIESLEENDKYNYSVEMLNDKDMYAVHLNLQFYDKIFINVGKGLKAEEMNISYHYNSDSTAVSIILYSPTGKKITSGLGSILDIELKQNGNLNRITTSGDEFKIAEISNNSIELTPVIIVTPEELGRIAQNETNENINNNLKLNFSLYPNPANPHTTFKAFLPEDGMYSFNMFDLNGRFLNTVANGYNKKGYLEHHLNLEPYSSGVYFIQMQSNSITSFQKLTILK